MACACSAWEPNDNTIRFCDTHHAYYVGIRRLTSVSAVIKRILPTDYSGVPPDVLETARIRGVAVDSYFSEYLRTGNVTIAAGERQDVLDRLTMLIPWWDKNGWQVMDVQRTVYSEADGIAGTYDFAVNEETVYDLKCVSALQPSYALQLGAYLTYGGFEIAGIVHVTKDRVRLVKYDAARCRRQWRAIVEAWKVCQELAP